MYGHCCAPSPHNFNLSLSSLLLHFIASLLRFSSPRSSAAPCVSALSFSSPQLLHNHRQRERLRRHRILLPRPPIPQPHRPRPFFLRSKFPVMRPASSDLIHRRIRHIRIANNHALRLRLRQKFPLVPRRRILRHRQFHAIPHVQPDRPPVIFLSRRDGHRFVRAPRARNAQQRQNNQLNSPPPTAA